MAIFRRQKDTQPDPTHEPTNATDDPLDWLDPEPLGGPPPAPVTPRLPEPRAPRAASLEERLLQSLRPTGTGPIGVLPDEVTDEELAEAEDADHSAEPPPPLLRARPRRPEPGTDVRRAIRRAVTRALAEDLGDQGDVTVAATVLPRAVGTATLFARGDGVVAGTDLVRETFAQVDPRLIVELDVEDGDRVSAGQQIGRVAGSLRSILTGERVALNFLSHLSGIATTTRLFVDAVQGTKAAIRDTRKTTPGLRLLEKMAVVAGGGVNHRLGLFDALLVKDNHNLAAGGVATAVTRALDRSGGRPAEVEVSSLAELDDAVEAGASEVLLDNFDLEDLRIAVARVPAEVVLEASGGVALDNVGEVAATGVHRIAIGALTHSADWLDIALDVTTVETTHAPIPVHPAPDVDDDDEPGAVDITADGAMVEVVTEVVTEMEDDLEAGADPGLFDDPADGDLAEGGPEPDGGVVRLDDPDDDEPGVWYIDELGLHRDTAAGQVTGADDVRVPDDLVDAFLDELERDAGEDESRTVD